MTAAHPAAGNTDPCRSSCPTSGDPSATQLLSPTVAHLVKDRDNHPRPCPKPAPPTGGDGTPSSHGVMSFDGVSKGSDSTTWSSCRSHRGHRRPGRRPSPSNGGTAGAAERARELLAPCLCPLSARPSPWRGYQPLAPKGLHPSRNGLRSSGLGSGTSGSTSSRCLIGSLSSSLRSAKSRCATSSSCWGPR